MAVRTTARAAAAVRNSAAGHRRCASTGAMHAQSLAQAAMAATAGAASASARGAPLPPAAATGGLGARAGEIAVQPMRRSRSFGVLWPASQARGTHLIARAETSTSEACTSAANASDQPSGPLKSEGGRGEDEREGANGDAPASGPAPDAAGPSGDGGTGTLGALAVATAVLLGGALALRLTTGGAPDGLPGAAEDTLAAIGGGTGALLWVRLFDWLTTTEKLDQKLSRKLVHIGSGPLFALTWPLFTASPHARVAAAAVPALNALRLVAIGTGALGDEDAAKAVSRSGRRDEVLRGPLYYVLVLLLATLACWRDSPVGAVALGTMCGGDGLADIVGRRLGKGNALPFNPQKSAAGSVAMFVGGWGMSALIVSARVRAHSCASRRARAVPVAPSPRVRFRPLPVADACSVASRVAPRRSWCCRPPRPHLP